MYIDKDILNAKLENLKMDISNYDVLGDVDIKELPKVNYNQLIDNLSKLKINNVKEKVEVIDDLIDDDDENIIVINKKDVTNTMEENDLDILKGINIPAFDTSKEIISNIEDINILNDSNTEEEKNIINLIGLKI